LSQVTPRAQLRQRSRVRGVTQIDSFSVSASSPTVEFQESNMDRYLQQL
ncbi:hypothetical protein Goarm_013020, partial [Gossypium armourianum]|nr:hypothetical protein [Gossypium armourianum]